MPLTETGSGVARVKDFIRQNELAKFKVPKRRRLVFTSEAASPSVHPQANQRQSTKRQGEMSHMTGVRRGKPITKLGYTSRLKIRSCPSRIGAARRGGQLETLITDYKYPASKDRTLNPV